METVEGVRPEDVLKLFLLQTRGLAEEPEDLFTSWWTFSNEGIPPNEIIQVGSYLMPNVRSELLSVLSKKPDFMRDINPHEFEHLVAELLRAQGYAATVTRSTRDRGMDIVAIRDVENRPYLTLVECKHWLAGNVGIEVVQRAIGVRHIEKADKSIIVTTARFSGPAKAEADKVQGEIELVDDAMLRSWLVDFDRMFWEMQR